MSKTDSDPELRSLASADLPSLLTSLEHSQAELRNLILSQRPSPSSSLNLAPCIIDFTPGEGGPDSCLWIANLLRIYEKEFVKEGWKWKVVNERWTSITGSTGAFGLKECSVEVFDPKAGRRGEGEVSRPRRASLQDRPSLCSLTALIFLLNRWVYTEDSSGRLECIVYR